MLPAEIAQAVVALMAIPEPWVLSIDRTEWQFGDCVFNILMLGVVHEGEDSLWYGVYSTNEVIPIVLNA